MSVSSAINLLDYDLQKDNAIDEELETNVAVLQKIDQLKEIIFKVGTGALLMLGATASHVSILDLSSTSKSASSVVNAVRGSYNVGTKIYTDNYSSSPLTEGTVMISDDEFSPEFKEPVIQKVLNIPYETEGFTPFESMEFIEFSYPEFDPENVLRRAPVNPNEDL